MYCVFINDDAFPFAVKIVNSEKTIETRNKNMLKKLIGYNVAVAKTGKGKKPLVIGCVTIAKGEFKTAAWLNENRNKTLIPENSVYNNAKGKWCYFLENAKACTPFRLPESAVYHGRSYCEF